MVALCVNCVQLETGLFFFFFFFFFFEGPPVLWF